MKRSDFHFELPPELIARYPLETRSDSRLLQLNENGDLRHGLFTDLLDLLKKNDLLVFNQSRVIPARLKGHKETGGRVEILLERLLDNHTLLVHLRASKTPAPGSFIQLSPEVRLQVKGRKERLFILETEDEAPALPLIERLGEIPLPPYLRRRAEALDLDRYQTVYAKDKGSVAAPTAGLHFDTAFLEKLRQKGCEFGYLTLHVGAGTFLPVQTDNILEHPMHPEWLELSATLCEQVRHTKEKGGRVIAVGTTSARGLETASQNGTLKPYSGDTSLFIYPGFQFHCIDLLLTNFHLPESTLLMLISALGGQEAVLSAYQEAVQKKYRFYSYGDACLISKKST